VLVSVAGTAEGEGGGNLNSLFMLPILLFLFSCRVLELADVALVVLSSCTVSVSGSSSLSSTVGSNCLGRFSPAEGGWLTNEDARAGDASDLEGGGMDERYDAGVDRLFGGGLAGENGNDACDID